MSIGADIQLSIFVVDDEEPVRELLGWMLEGCGHVVHAAPDGDEALGFFRANGPVDLALSDINMPGGHGWGDAVASYRDRIPNRACVAD